MGKSRLHRRCCSFLSLTGSFWRWPLSKRTVIFATVCGVYLVFMVSYIGYSQQHKRTYTHKDRHTRGLESSNGAFSYSVDLQTGASVVIPTRSNVVYITLKFKRMKPANIRGTTRPKLRRKVRKNKTVNSAFTHDKFSTFEGDAWQSKRDVARNKETGDGDKISLHIVPESPNDEVADFKISSIRIYSQQAPQWFSPHDVKVMRFLADAKVLRIREVVRNDSPSLLMFDGETREQPPSNQNHTARDSVCAGRCGVIGSPVDNSEVFAFHLDRVLGLNKTLPAVSRKFRFVHDGQPCPVVLWDASLYPEGLAAGWNTVRLTWGSYQRSLKQRCWHKNISPKLDSDCSTIHHYEWSKLALFDFLLQVHSRLDKNCCGFKPRQEDLCVVLGHHAECVNQDHIQLANIIHRDHDPRHLVLTNNKGFFDRNEDNLDFKLLEGITELPEQAVSVLRSRRLREKLIQSLFLDQTYWESQGGRQGIDKLIDVIERRAKVLLTYINSHGIKIVTMDA